MSVIVSVRQALKRAGRFVRYEIWDVELSSLSRLHSLGVRSLRVVSLVCQGFKKDECPLHASALTFATLMSIVPVLALSLALARGLGNEETARTKIRDGVSQWTQTFRAVDEINGSETNAVTAGNPGAGGAAPSEVPLHLAEEIDRLVEVGFDKVAGINFAALGGVGFAVLLWMVIQVLGRVEASFNRVWGVTTRRTIWRCFTDYLSVVVVMPFLVIAATSLPVAEMASRYLDGSAESLVQTALGSVFLKNLTVLLLTSLTFTFVIMFMPNTRVRLSPGFAGGLVSALLFLGWLWVCATLQVGVAKWGRFYGSFAIVPILLAWLFVSWEIVLFGAEVAFAVQNHATYSMEQGAVHASMRARIHLGLAVMAEAARVMVSGEGCMSVAEYAGRERVSVRLLNDVIRQLTAAGLLAELSERKQCYVLLKSPADLLVSKVIEALTQSGIDPRGLGLTDHDTPVARAMKRVYAGIEASLRPTTVRDLVDKQK